MSTKPDPTDTSKMFGSTLDDLLNSIFESERKDFDKQLHNKDFLAVLTARELKSIQRWWEADTFVKMPRVEMLKCGHPYALASVLWAVIRD